MPKIIENLQQKLMEEAKRQVQESGYSAVTIRSVAGKCGVGVGTVYNYFPSKDALLASYLLEDWKSCIGAVTAAEREADSPLPVARCIWEQLRYFAGLHRKLFEDAAAAAGFAGSFSQYHGVLRSQLAAPLRRFCGSDFAAEFAAEALLTWTMAGKDFDELYGMIGKLF